MQIIKGILEISSHISLLFIVFYVFWIISNLSKMFKSNMYGEEVGEKTWNPFKLVFDEEQYGPEIFNWLKPVVLVGLLYSLLKVWIIAEKYNVLK